MNIILNRIVYNFFVDGEPVSVECKEEKASYKQKITSRYFTVTAGGKEPIMYATTSRISKKRVFQVLNKALEEFVKK